MEAYYKQKIAEITEETTLLKKKNDRVAGFRLFLIIALGFLIYKGFSIHYLAGVVVVIGGIAGFYYLVKYHEKIELDIDLHITTIELIRNELACLAGNANVYYNGSEYNSPSHHFSDDLDIFGESSLFHLINRTKSKAGNDYLAKNLLSEDQHYTISEKQEAAKELKSKTEWRLNFLASMFNLSNEDRGVTSILSRIEEPPPIKFERLISLYNIVLPFLWIAVAASSYFKSLTFAGYAAAVLFMINYFFVLINKKPTEDYFNTVSGAGRIMQKYGIATALIVQENWTSKILKESYESMPISKLNSRNPIDDFVVILKKLDMRRNQFASIFLYLASPFEPVQLIRLRKWLQEHPDFFLKIFDTIGVFEASSSLGTLSFNKPGWSFPEINETGKFSLEGTQIGHPLIKGHETVCNDFLFDDTNRLTLITGSNMSGKSTFLRTIGLNIVLAYAGAPVFAGHLKVSPGIKLICYMRIKDSIQQNASTFKAEIERIKLVLAAINAHENSLFLIDEMLRGTNSEDKLAGSMALLEKIAQSDAFAMVATHDLRMTEISDKYPDKIKNYYFEYSTENGELLFDYQIKNGVCKSFNASLLLKSIGLELNS
jgi:hypothetical protein